MMFPRKFVMACAATGLLAGGATFAQAAPAGLLRRRLPPLPQPAGPQIQKVWWHRLAPLLALRLAGIIGTIGITGICH